MPNRGRPKHNLADRKTIYRLPDRAKAVLAVLLAAALWPERFEDGWVTVGDFRSCGSGLAFRGKPEKNKLESAKATIGRAIREICAVADAPHIQAGYFKLPGQRAREDVRRVLPPMSLRLQHWLFTEGLGFLTEDVCAEFRTVQHKPVQGLASILLTLQGSIVSRLLYEGRYDEAIARVERALSDGPSEGDRRSLEQMYAAALLARGGAEDAQKAEALLEQLSQSANSMLVHSQRVTYARAKLCLAQCLLRHLKLSDPTASASGNPFEVADRIELLLSQANELATDLSLGDRAQILSIAALLLSWKAQTFPDSSRRPALDRAEWCLRQAIEICRMAHESYTLTYLVFNLGELFYFRDGVSRGAASEEEIRNALAWFEASIRYTQDLGLARHWINDYARAAQCHVRLIPHFARVGDMENARQALRQALEYVEVARTHVRESTMQWALVEQAASLAEDTRREYLDSN
jgi:tetratricopeptide (TPR) repeat protein